MPTLQEAYGEIFQDQKDTFDNIKLDNMKIMQNIPLAQLLSVLSKDANNIPEAIDILTEYFNENLIDMVNGGIEVAVIRAIKTFFGWEKSLK